MISTKKNQKKNKKESNPGFLAIFGMFRKQPRICFFFYSFLFFFDVFLGFFVIFGFPWFPPKRIKKNQKKEILGCFLKILEIAKNPGFDSFLIFFDYFLILFGGNHGNQKIAKNPRKKSKKHQKKQNIIKKNKSLVVSWKSKKSLKIQDLILFCFFFNYFLIIFWFFNLSLF